ncbi:DUF1549 domain-containing protein, partial [bacterium]
MKLEIPARRPLASAVFGLSGLTLFGSVVFAAQAPTAPAVANPEQTVFFETKIRPVLADNCFKCHGAKMQMGDIRLDSAAAFQKGKLLTGSDPEKSLLVHVVRYTGPVKMPPKTKLKPEQIADLEAWVKMGAPWPAGGGEKPKTKAPLWSLQPVKKPPVPKVKNAAWSANPLDTFVLAKLEAKKLTPAPAADRRTLLRRVTFDLIGLPPTSAEMDAFLADKSPQAYGKVVDRLLASPRYGERQARAWLDVARYSDTKGYVFVEDRNYPNAYTFRKWVIDAFNRDLS